MAIWKSKLSFEDIERRSKNTLPAHLGIRITEIGDDYVKATMPVDDRTKQPLGLLHGGASVALTESVGSLGARMTLEPGLICVGMEINANHIRSVRQGLVTGVATRYAGAYSRNFQGKHKISLELKVKKNFSTTLKMYLLSFRVSSLIHGVPATACYFGSIPISAFYLARRIS